jgi:hypothetical protein
MVGHVIEDVMQEGPRRIQGGGIQRGGMGRVQVSQATILAVRSPSRPARPVQVTRR